MKIIKNVFVWLSVGSFHQTECEKSYRKETIRLIKDLLIAIVG